MSAVFVRAAHGGLVLSPRSGFPTALPSLPPSPTSVLALAPIPHLPGTATTLTKDRHTKSAARMCTFTNGFYDKHAVNESLPVARFCDNGLYKESRRKELENVHHKREAATAARRKEFAQQLAKHTETRRIEAQRARQQRQYTIAYENMLRTEERAALAMQRLGRGYLGRRKHAVLMLQQSPGHAATLIQKRFRGVQARDRPLPPSRAVQRATIRLQRAMRRALVRRGWYATTGDVERILAVTDRILTSMSAGLEAHAATVVQANARGLRARSLLRRQRTFSSDTRALMLVLKLQSLVRRKQARSKAKRKREHRGSRAERGSGRGIHAEVRQRRAGAGTSARG